MKDTLAKLALIAMTAALFALLALPLAGCGTGTASGKASSDTGAVEIAGEQIDPDATRVALEKKDLTGDDLQRIASLGNLRELKLTRCDIPDLSQIGEMAQLKRLSLYDCRGVDNLSALRGLVNLESLDLFNMAATDISPLAGLKGLRALYLGDTDAADYSPIASLADLEVLDLTAVPVGDLSFLKGLANLKTLVLTAETAKDLSPVYGLSNLEDLSLSGEGADLGALVPLKNLKTLTLYGRAPIDYDGLDALQKANPGLRVEMPGQMGY